MFDVKGIGAIQRELRTGYWEEGENPNFDFGFKPDQKTGPISISESLVDDIK